MELTKHCETLEHLALWAPAMNKFTCMVLYKCSTEDNLLRRLINISRFEPHQDTLWLCVKAHLNSGLDQTNKLWSSSEQRLTCRWTLMRFAPVWMQRNFLLIKEKRTVITAQKVTKRVSCRREKVRAPGTKLVSSPCFLFHSRSELLSGSAAP